MRNAPCFTCQSRHEGCHSKCELYKTYDEENKRNREERLARKENDERLSRYKYRGKNNYENEKRKGIWK